MQQEQAIGDGGRFREIVGGDENRGLLSCQGADGGPEAGGGAGVKAAGGFIEQEHAGALDESARDPEALIHTAGELHDQRVGLVDEAGRCV